MGSQEDLNIDHQLVRAYVQTMQKSPLYFLFVLLMLFGCSHSSKTESKLMHNYQVVNLGKNFSQFWEKSKAEPFEVQLRIWDEVIEAPYQEFYNEMVWQKSRNPQWRERKLRRLKEFFGKYPTLYPAMMSEFDQFDSTLKLQIEKFVQFFPDANFDLPIYAAPTVTFNGKGGEGGESGDKLGKTVLAFGIDMIIDLKNDPDVLYSHELFHIYHTSAIGMNEQVFFKQGRLTLPLWLEGLATYVSQKMNPNASPNAVLMDKDLPKVSRPQIRQLAKMFLKESDEAAFDMNKPEIYKKWFAVDPGFKLQGPFPARSGYLLGLKVAEDLSKNHSLHEMVHWNVDAIHSHVKIALSNLSR